LDLGKITVEVNGTLLRCGVSVAGVSRLIRDHLDAVHTAVKRRLFTCMKAALRTDERAQVNSM
jgi:hypothetical protein